MIKIKIPDWFLSSCLIPSKIAIKIAFHICQQKFQCADNVWFKKQEITLFSSATRWAIPKEASKSSRKVAISWLPVLLHHRTYRSGIRRFVRIIMNMFPFAKWSSNYRSRHSPPYANIYCSAFAAVLDCGISDKVSYWCCPTYKPLIARYLSSSGWQPLFLFASIFAMSLSEGGSEPSHQAFACYS